MTVGIKYVGREALGSCPAAVSMEEDGSAVFLINEPVFRIFTHGQQQFILAHELGHRLLKTSREELADAFALGLTAGRQRRSLKEAIYALAKLETVPISRLQALYRLCLQADRKH